jgi:hypothetical protein
MNKQARIAFGGVAMALVVSLGLAGPWAYERGHLWKTTAPLASHWKDLKVCPVHQVRIEVEKTENFRIQCVEYPMEYVKAMRTDFPLASTDPVLSSSPDPKVGWVMIGYCPECRKEQKRWTAATEASRAAP